MKLLFARLTHCKLTIIWSVLFIYDMTYGIGTSLAYAFPLAFIATAYFAYTRPVIRPNSPRQFIAWVAILGWLIFFIFGMSIKLFTIILPEPYAFAFNAYLSWTSLSSIIVVSLLLSIFSYCLFKQQAIKINLMSSLLVGTILLLAVGIDNLILSLDILALISLLCFSTYCLQRLAIKSTKTSALSKPLLFRNTLLEQK